MSSILGSISSPPYATNYSSGANGSTTFDDVSEVDLSLVSSTSGSASVSLSSDLSGVSASTQTGQLAVSFAQAIEQATSVDPTTGKREIQEGKAGELATALNSLLTQNGFTQDQASQATQSIENELATGAPISLSTSYDTMTSSSVSATGAYGANGVWTANSVTQTDRSGTLNISIDASGQLNVALSSQTVSTAQYTGEIKGTGTAPDGPVVVDLPGVGGANQAISLGGSGATTGAPAVQSFAQAAQSALAALVGAMPDNLMNGASAPNGSSGVKEHENDAAIATASTVAVLMTTSTGSASDAPGSNADGGDGSNNGNKQSQASGTTDSTGATNSNGNGAGPTDNSLSTLLSAVKSEASSLVSLLDSVSKTTLTGTKDTQKQLKDLLDMARQAFDPNAASSAGATHGVHGGHGADETDSAGQADDASGTGSANGTSNVGSASLSSSSSLSIEISFTQTISIQLVDAQGYGSTLYGRPDGSLGKMVTRPTHVTA